jgi:hypothetical protein
VGFDPLESNWPLRVSFPIFIANAVDWLNPANAKNSQLLIKAGDPFRLALAEPVKKASEIARRNNSLATAGNRLRRYGEEAFITCAPARTKPPSAPTCSTPPKATSVRVTN